jgi:hypothetical protein
VGTTHLLNVNQFEWTATIMFIARIANEHEPIRFARLEEQSKAIL